MRRLTAFSLPLLLTAPLAAQSGSRATLTLGVGAGVHAGHSLWEVPKQPLTIIGTNPASYDTLRLSRAVNSGLVFTAQGTYFSSDHLGLHLELAYLDVPQGNACDSVFMSADPPYDRNAQLCNNIQGTVMSNTVIRIGGGATLRAAPRGRTSPYVRGSVGAVLISSSSIEVAGAYLQSGQQLAREVISDPSPKSFSLGFTLAAGATAPLGTGYQLRLEVRDDIFSLARVSGPANALGQAPTGTKFYHHVGLTIGFDVVLERQRGRRY